MGFLFQPKGPYCIQDSATEGQGMFPNSSVIPAPSVAGWEVGAQEGDAMLEWVRSSEERTHY